MRVRAVSGLNLGPILAMVNGPIVGDAIKDPNNAINKLVLARRTTRRWWRRSTSPS